MTSPYGRALREFWGGVVDSSYVIHRDDGFSATIAAADSFATGELDPLEQMALERAQGAVLDVGAGVGRHALVLQERGLTVTAIDTEPDLVQIMKERGVVDPRTKSVLEAEGTFGTVLMLMNGFGLVGTPSGGARFLAHARGLLAPGGQILCDSLDVRETEDSRHLTYQQENVRAVRPAGQMRFCIEHDGQRGDAFDWIHLDFDALRALAEAGGWRAEMLRRGEDGHYLARLW